MTDIPNLKFETIDDPVFVGEVMRATLPVRIRPYHSEGFVYRAVVEGMNVGISIDTDGNVTIGEIRGTKRVDAYQIAPR